MRRPVILAVEGAGGDGFPLVETLLEAGGDLAVPWTCRDAGELPGVLERCRAERRSLAVIVAPAGEGTPFLRELARLRGDADTPPPGTVLLGAGVGLAELVAAKNEAGVDRVLDPSEGPAPLATAVRELLRRHLVARGLPAALAEEALDLEAASRRLRHPGPGVRRARIAGIGTYVPPRLLTNEDLERMVDTTSEWIVQRTGIRVRHLVEPGQATSDIAVEAARAALARAGVAPAELDAILVATTTPDHRFPATACLVQEALGASRAWGFDLGAACCGFLFALSTGAHLVADGSHRRVLVIGADVMSSIIDYEDRATCVLFGDGAGAVVLVPADDRETGVLDHVHLVDGSGKDALKMPAGGSRLPPSHETVEKRLHYVHQDGRAVFRFAVRRLEEMARLVLDRNDLAGEDLDALVPHQANRRIILAAAERLGLAREKVVLNLDRYGNTTAASIPLALAEAVEDGRIRDGSLVLLAAVGAGFTMGATLLRWG